MIAPVAAQAVAGTGRGGSPISETALALAVDRAILSTEQVERLRACEREVANDSPGEPADDESLRFVTGFADVFVTLGIVLFVGALAYIMDLTSGSPLAFAGIACSTWLLAEFFTHKRRMALPSIVLLVLFVGAVFFLSLQVFNVMLPPPKVLAAKFWFLPTRNPAALAVAAIATAALAALHFVRFRVPVTIAAGAAALCLVGLAVAAIIHPALTGAAVNIVLLVCGLAVFALAMRFDTSDPARLTRRTDIAFWLHLLAAPLIVHPLIRSVLRVSGGDFTSAAAIEVLWLFVLLGLVAVVIDRRAIIVAGLVYAGIAFAVLFRSIGFGSHATTVVPLVLLALGGFILLLSAGWLPLRRALLRRLPLWLSCRLPHPLLESTT